MTERQRAHTQDNNEVGVETVHDHFTVVNVQYEFKTGCSRNSLNY